MQFGVEPARLRRAGTAPEFAPHQREPGRHRALERKDRLLLVADGKQRARRRAGPFAGEEFLDQRLHHLPLARAGILRLVNKDVLDAAVELVMHPLGCIRACQQVGRLDDEIVKIERPARRLQPLVGRDGSVGQVQHGSSGDEALGRGHAVEQHLQTREFGRNRLGEAIPAILHRLGDQTAGSPQIAVGLGAEVKIGSGARRIVYRREIRPKALSGLAVARPAFAEHANQADEIRVGQDALRDDGRMQALRRIVGGKAEPRPQLGERRIERTGRGDPFFDACALGDESLNGKFVRHVAAGIEHGGERLAKRSAARRLAEHAAPRRLGQLGGLALVEHLEMAGDIRLEGKLLQQPFAEGMDGLDLQPARRLQGAGEEPPCPRQLNLARLAAFDLLDRAGKCLVGQHRPFAETLEDTGFHFRRRGLGEGQAEDTAGFRAGKQQPHDALGEYEGLARAGIGRHPGGRARVRRLGLGLARLGVDHGAGGCHSHSSSSSLSTRPHSRTRARWS